MSSRSLLFLLSVLAAPCSTLVGCGKVDRDSEEGGAYGAAGAVNRGGSAGGADASSGGAVAVTPDASTGSSRDAGPLPEAQPGCDLIDGCQSDTLCEDACTTCTCDGQSFWCENHCDPSAGCATGEGCTGEGTLCGYRGPCAPLCVCRNGSWDCVVPSCARECPEQAPLTGWRWCSPEVSPTCTYRVNCGYPIDCGCQDLGDGPEWSCTEPGTCR